MYKEFDPRIEQYGVVSAKILPFAFLFVLSAKKIFEERKENRMRKVMSE